MTDAQRQELVRELTCIKDRMLKRSLDVGFRPVSRKILRDHLADINRRDEIERQLSK